MIDSRAVLMQIERGNYPSNWHVYRFQPENISAVIWWECAGIAVVISFLCALSSGIVAFFCLLLTMLISVGLAAIIYTKRTQTNDRLSQLFYPQVLYNSMPKIPKILPGFISQILLKSNSRMKLKLQGLTATWAPEFIIGLMFIVQMALI